MSFSPGVARLLSFLALALTLLFVLQTRIALLDIPLERDEGGFAYVAKAMFEGTPLYTELRDTKLPGLYVVYGVILKLFGETPAGVHTGLLLFNLATILLLFFMARKIFNPMVASVAAASYAVFSITPGIFGFATHATHLAALPGLGGVYLLWMGMERRKPLLLLFTGLLFSIAFTIKHPSVHYMLFAGVYLLVRELMRKPKDWKFLITGMSAMVMGSIALYVLTVLVVVSQGSFKEFWFWTVQWPSEFAGILSVSERLNLFKFMFGLLTTGQTYLWILAGVGVLFTVPSKISADKKLFLYLFLTFMFAAVGTGFHSYPHYFVLALAPVSIFVGLFVGNTATWLVNRYHNRLLAGIPLIVFVVAWSQILTVEPDYFSNPNHRNILRSKYGTNPFPESLELGQFIRDRRQPGDEMIVFGSEPQMYLYADCNAASGHVFIYPLVDGGRHSTRLQDELIQEVTDSQPRFLVYVTTQASWLNKDPSNRLVNWMQNYVTESYVPVAIADIFSDQTIYKWNEESRDYQPRSQSAVFVFERRSL